MSWKFWKKEVVAVDPTPEAGLEEERALIIRTEEVRELERISQRAETLSNQLDKYSEENEALITERRELKEEVEDLKLKKKIETEDIEHMVKMKLEAADIDKQKFEIKLEGEKNDAIHVVKAEHQEKLTAILEQQIEQGEERYKQILEKLSTVNVDLGRQDVAAS